MRLQIPFPDISYSRLCNPSNPSHPIFDSDWGRGNKGKRTPEPRGGGPHWGGLGKGEKKKEGEKEGGKGERGGGGEGKSEKSESLG